MNSTLDKIKALIAKHRKEIEPLLSKDEPVIARPPAAHLNKPRHSASQHMKIKVDENTENPEDKGPENPRTKKDANSKRSSKPKKEDGKVTVDPDFAQDVGNPDVKGESLVTKYQQFLVTNT